MTGFQQPEPVTRETARAMIDGWRADTDMVAVSIVSPYRSRAYALSCLWADNIMMLEASLGTLWADDIAHEYGLISWKT